MYRKYIRIIKTFMILLITMTSIYAQHDGSSSREPDEVCYKHEALDLGYYIKLNGTLYNNWESAFICESDLVANIEIFYNESEAAVQGSNWDWSNCDCTGQNSAYASIAIGDFVSDKLTIEVTFKEEQVGHPNYSTFVTLKLYVYLITNVAINDKATHAIVQYAYDENSFPDYPIFVNSNATYGSTSPWKFIPNGLTDKITITGHKNLLKGASITTKDINNMTSSSLSYNPTGQELDIHHIGPPGAELNLKTELCSSNILLNTDTYPMKTISIDVYSLAESDDDQVNYCLSDRSKKKNCMDLITDPNHKCILPGIDGSLDLYNNPTWVKPTDDIYKPNNLIMEVRAGADLYCNSTPRTNNTSPFLTSLDIVKLQNDLNTVYNSIGLNITLIDKGMVKRNYDSYKDDNKIDAANEEHTNFHISEYGGGPNSPPTCWIVPGLINSANNTTLRGLGTASGYRTLYLNEYSNVDRTFSHELGHAYFGLFHPDENGHWQLDNLKSSVSNDYYNLMNSGNIYNTGTTHLLSEYKLRRYQWRKIYENL